MAGSATLTVIIVDQNDNSPTIPLPSEIRIPESEYTHSIVPDRLLIPDRSVRCDWTTGPAQQG